MTSLQRLLLFITLISAGSVHGQQEAGKADSLLSFYDMSLSELDSIKGLNISSELEGFINSLTSVSTQKALSRRNAPSLITVITREDIQLSGATDLMEVLRMIPGFQFALDEKGRIGLGIRGNWANEGKVLLMIDGHTMNDVYAANLSFGNHYPVDLIEQIEVIRGPGSSIYGGFAEYGVINITTTDPNKHNGGKVGLGFSRMSGTYGLVNSYLYLGKKWKNFAMDYTYWGGSGNRSNRSHYAYFKDTTNGVGAYSTLAQNSLTISRYINLRASYKNVWAKILTDIYGSTDINLMHSDSIRDVATGINAGFFELGYRFKLGKKLTLEPKFNSVIHIPLLAIGSDTLIRQANNNNVNRGRFNLSAIYDHSHRSSFVAGVDLFTDRAPKSDDSLFVIGPDSVEYDNAAFYAQSIIRLPFLHITSGVRLELNSAFDSEVVPRLALTHTHGKWHYKLLANYAYRAPSIGNVSLSYFRYSFNVDSTDIILEKDEGSIKAERTLFMELETGYLLNPNTMITLNLFNISTWNPISYGFYQDQAMVDVFGYRKGVAFYRNDKQSGSKGMELEYLWQNKQNKLSANYAFYTVGGKPKVENQTVMNYNVNWVERHVVVEDHSLGFAKHQFNLAWTRSTLGKISLHTSANFIGSRYGYDIVTSNSKDDITHELTKEMPALLLNFFMSWRNLAKNHMNLGLGFYNILNTNYRFMQPVVSIDNPMPDASREFRFKLEYNFQFKNRSQDKISKEGENE